MMDGWMGRWMDSWLAGWLAKMSFQNFLFYIVKVTHELFPWREVIKYECSSQKIEMSTNTIKEFQ